MRTLVVVLSCFLASLAGTDSLQPAQAALPPALERHFTSYAKLDGAERQQLLSGAPVTTLLDADPSKEVAVFGAVWIDAPVERYLAAVHDIERFESGGSFRVTKKLSSPPQLQDFAQLQVPDDDVKDLQSCKVGDCDLKLSEATIDRIRREIDWTKPDARKRVNAIIRELALQYATSYLKGGNERLAVYRDSDRPTFVAKEFASMVDRLPALTEYLPGIRRYLLDFPKATLPDSESFLYWQEAEFGLKPTVRLNHVVIARDAAGATIASKMLYASHYFWTALELRVLVKDPARGEGFWFVTESRSRSDGLSGFTGRIVRGKARDEVKNGTMAVLRATKGKMER